MRPASRSLRTLTHHVEKVATGHPRPHWWAERWIRSRPKQCMRPAAKARTTVARTPAAGAGPGGCPAFSDGGPPEQAIARHPSPPT